MPPAPRTAKRSPNPRVEAKRRRGATCDAAPRPDGAPLRRLSESPRAAKAARAEDAATAAAFTVPHNAAATFPRLKFMLVDRYRRRARHSADCDREEFVLIGLTGSLRDAAQQRLTVRVRHHHGDGAVRFHHYFFVGDNSVVPALDQSGAVAGNPSDAPLASEVIDCATDTDEPQGGSSIVVAAAAAPRPVCFATVPLPEGCTTLTIHVPKSSSCTDEAELLAVTTDAQAPPATDPGSTSGRGASPSSSFPRASHAEALGHVVQHRLPASAARALLASPEALVLGICTFNRFAEVELL